MKRIILLLVTLCFVVGTFQAKVPTTEHKIRLTDNWEFLRQDVGNIWELVRPMKTVSYTHLTLPTICSV